MRHARRNNPRPGQDMSEPVLCMESGGLRVSGKTIKGGD
jgi:hypothetical protein